MMKRFHLVSLFVALTSAGAQTPALPAQPRNPPAFDEEVGSLQSRYDRAAWQSPEAILTALQSKKDETRLAAFGLLGAEGHDAYDFRHTKEMDFEVVADLYQSELRYASLGDDGVQDAIVAVRVRNRILIAVAAPKNVGWERVAAFRYVCMADLRGNDRELLDSTIAIGRYGNDFFEREELILRPITLLAASRGITPLSTQLQHEVHFRLFAGGLRRTLLFERRRQTCERGRDSCAVTLRSFYHFAFGQPPTIDGGIVVEAYGSGAGFATTSFDTELEDRSLSFTSCSALRFNQDTHQFEKSSTLSSPPDPCLRFLPKKAAEHR
jgi:hypothetical protein